MCALRGSSVSSSNSSQDVSYGRSLVNLTAAFCTSGCWRLAACCSASSRGAVPEVAALTVTVRAPEPDRAYQRPDGPLLWASHHQRLPTLGTDRRALLHRCPMHLLAQAPPSPFGPTPVGGQRPLASAVPRWVSGSSPEPPAHPTPGRSARAAVAAPPCAVVYPETPQAKGAWCMLSASSPMYRVFKRASPLTPNMGRRFLRPKKQGMFSIASVHCSRIVACTPQQGPIPTNSIVFRRP